MMPRFLAVAVLLMAVVFAAAIGCTRDSPGPPDEATPTPTPVLSGTIVFSGQWQGIGGTFTVDLATNQYNSLSDVMSYMLQTSGYADEFLFVHPTGQVYIAPFSSSEVRLIADAREAFLAPNGRKFFYNDPNGGLFEGATSAFGGLPFAADGTYGSHSPDLTRVAYLSAQGLVLADADGGDPTVVDLASLLLVDEQFVLPTEGDYFPRWTSDSAMVAAPLLIQNVSTEATRPAVVIVDSYGQLVLNLSNGSLPIWNADGRSLFFVSSGQLWLWNLDDSSNTLIAGGGDVTCLQARLNDNGTLLAFIQEDGDGLLSLIVFDLTTHNPYVIIPGAMDGVLSMDWRHASSCGETDNSAPEVAVSVLLNGVPTENPVITPGDDAQFELNLSDAECNLAYGVAIWQAGDQPWRPLSAALPVGSGCETHQVTLPAPENPNGSYEMKVAVEDICGARSADFSFPITYEGFADDDTTDDDTVIDDDTADDDTTT